MKRFNDYFESEYLEESLNTPIEFYMTDDTKIPKEIYAAFEIDGTQYGISLVLANGPRFYTLNFYRIQGDKKRYWAFLKMNHVRRCLSTIIKFVEASIPFIESKYDGFIIPLPGKTGSEKYVKFLELVIRKSYLRQKLRSVPIIKKSESARNYLFMVRKGVQPTKIFNSKVLKKFEYDPENPTELNDKVMDAVSEPYKILKQTASTKPSTKYAFGAFKVELVGGDELIDMLNTATEENLKSPQVSGGKGIFIYNTNSIANNKELSIPFTENDDKIGLNFPYLVSAILPNAYKNIKKDGYDESKIDDANLKFSAKQGFNKLSEPIKKQLIQLGIFSSSGDIEDLDKVKNALKAFSEIPIMYMKQVDSKIRKVVDSANWEKLKLPQEPTSTLDAFDSANESLPQSGSLGFVENNESAYSKMKAVLEMPEVQEWYSNFTETPDGKNVVLYTGMGAGSMNGGLRDSIKSGKEFNFDSLKYNTMTNYGNKTIKLMKYFKKAPKLSNGIWVYRNAKKIDGEKYEVGTDYIDPAFLSTSVRSTMSLGETGNLRLKIYLPAGTPCFPVFEKSKHPNEDEIILAPLSVLKITERYENESNGRIMIVCVYSGHSFTDVLKKGKEGIMIEQKKTPSTKNSKQAVGTNSSEKNYDPEAKWSGAPTKDQLDALRKTLKSGKLKLKF